MTVEPKLEEYFGMIWVRCPKCQGNALIRCEHGRGSGLLKNRLSLLHWSNPALSCNSCGFHLTKTSKDWSDHKKWYGPWMGLVDTACNRCGNKIQYRTELTNHKAPNIDLACKSCNQEGTFQLRWMEGGNNGIDPYFGLEFFYSKMIKGDSLWVLNKAHCEKLISYIGAGHRADNQREKWSMISNLPKWMILAKNRESVLKALLMFKAEMSGQPQA